MIIRNCSSTINKLILLFYVGLQDLFSKELRIIKFSFYICIMNIDRT